MSVHRGGGEPPGDVLQGRRVGVDQAYLGPVRPAVVGEKVPRSHADLSVVVTQMSPVHVGQLVCCAAPGAG